MQDLLGKSLVYEGRETACTAFKNIKFGTHHYSNTNSSSP